MKQKISQLTNIKTFWEDVRNIVGYYDNSIHIEDWEIKELQRWADYYYQKLLEKEKGV